MCGHLPRSGARKIQIGFWILDRHVGPGHLVRPAPSISVARQGNTGPDAWKKRGISQSGKGYKLLSEKRMPMRATGAAHFRHGPGKISSMPAVCILQSTGADALTPTMDAGTNLVAGLIVLHYFASGAL